MEKRRFGKTGWEVSEVGLGCWQLGGDCWGDLADKEAFAILRSAVRAGVNFLDTADVYGNGRSEKIIGKFLQQHKGRPFVATKLGRMPHIFPDNFSEENLAGCIDDSLERLGLPIIDLAQLHCPPTRVLMDGGVFGIMDKLQADGKIRYWGVSVETVEEGLACIKNPGCVSLQVIFNIFRQKPAEELFAKARERDVALVVRLPLASGLLSGKMSECRVFPDNDHRRFNCDGQMFNVGETFAGLPYAKGVGLAKDIGGFLPGDVPMAQAAIRWILDHKEVTTVIPGASTVAQAEANAGASGLPVLTPATHKSLAEFYSRKVRQLIRGPY
jgi:aryl-alcohol dehydrogenase-like predicted oxidoreductase